MNDIDKFTERVEKLRRMLQKQLISHDEYIGECSDRLILLGPPFDEILGLFTEKEIQRIDNFLTKECQERENEYPVLRLFAHGTRLEDHEIARLKVKYLANYAELHQQIKLRISECKDKFNDS